MTAEQTANDVTKAQGRPDLKVVPLYPRHSTQLETLQDVRREMGRVYRSMKRRKIPMEDGTKLTYVLTNLAKIIQTSDLDLRTAALERAMKQRTA